MPKNPSVLLICPLSIEQLATKTTPSMFFLTLIFPAQLFQEPVRMKELEWGREEQGCLILVVPDPSDHLKCVFLVSGLLWPPYLQ